MIYKTIHREKPLVLVADDDLSLRLSIGAALKKIGFDILEAENGLVALERFKVNKPDLILMDVNMPEMDGFETCKAIREYPEGKYPQIIMVTGLDDTESTIKAFEAGANDFISKPINWVMLGQRAKYTLRAGIAFRDLSLSQSRLAKTQELAKLGTWLIDIDSNIFQCSPQASNVLGLNDLNRQITYDDFFTTIQSQEKSNVKKKVDEAIRFNDRLHINYQIDLPNGTQKHILNQGEPLINKNNQTDIYLGVVQDVSKLKQAEEEIRYLAFYDSLTGLANRKLFLDRLDLEIQKAQRNNQKFAILFIDLDHFKSINDTLGHHNGDLLLKNVAQTLKENIRGTDTVSHLGKESSESLIARLGGDEFTILLSNIKKPESAAIVARRLLKKIAKPYQLEGNSVTVTSSIGVSVFPSDGSDPDTLLKHADSAMYHAKNKGKNNYQFYKESLNLAIAEHFNIEKDLKKAAERGEFVLFYQPQIRLQDRKIIGAEALIRWVHPQKGMIAPNQFIPIAEESDLILDINKWVLQTACEQNNKWKNEGLSNISVAVNLSAYKFTEQHIIKSLLNIFDGSKDSIKNFELEITENIFMRDTDEIVSILTQMKDLGFRIALDDFGTGYSSLKYLATFPVDTIKIDRSFIMGMGLQENNHIIIKAIIAMGHSMGKRIIAEGIETEEQFQMLQDYGCDEGQGFYFKPPVQASEFSSLLKRGLL